MKSHRGLSLILLAACGIGLAPMSRAQTSFPMLGSVYPVCVQRGKTTEVTVRTGGNGGGNIYGAYKALLEGDGIQAEIVPPEKGWPAKDPKKPNETPVVGEVKVRLTVAPDAQLGVRELRLGTPRYGISSVGQVVISDEPQVTEAEPNDDAAHAQAVMLPCVANGSLQQGEDVDYYKFKVTAGQEVVLTALCARLEDKIHDLQEHADPLLIITDSAGNEIARNDDYYRADPLLHVKFEKAGEYVVQIRDVSYRGNPHWVYALTLTTRPYVTAVVPCAVQPGQSNELHVAGFNLGDTKTVKLDVPANAPRGLWSAQLKLPNGLSNAVPLLVSDTPQRAIAQKPEAGNRPVTATLEAKTSAVTGTLALPGGVSGALMNPGEIDRYTFHTKKGMLWSFEVTARRLNSEMDSEIKIRNAKGEVQATNDDAIGKDSRIDVWKAPEDGDYTIEVRDLTGHAGPTYFYNLTSQAVRPDFGLRCDTDRAMISPGNRTTWYVLVDRKNAFVGPVTVEVKGLPAGVTASPLTVPAEVGVGTLFLTAAPDAKIDTAAVQIVGTGTLIGEGGKPVPTTRVVRPLTEIYIPGGGRGLLEAETQGVSVTEQNDLEVSVNTQTVSLAPGGTVKIEVEVKRRPDYTKPVTLDIKIQHLGGVFVDPLPPGVTVDDGASKTLLGDNETKGYITLRAAADAKPIQNLPIAVLANASINFVMKVWYASPPVVLTVTPPAKK